MGFKCFGDKPLAGKRWYEAEVYQTPEQELAKLVGVNQVFLDDLLKESSGRYGVGELDLPPCDISKAVSNTRRLTAHLHRM